ncbi:hypothetical protein Athai_55630 [Actinocatenispora thailandica]|uniref:Nucleotidyltransferase n=1 Tax=Actinocatenispora thailandica TaxID=227318 RepID=A0A7R7DUR4_9ACTN|nr:hypothetical protein [Actinocatenispora thailandica]BCJ38060.1 hypothetical protein Athai_55630 [Actinocatenispora thailandica]
MRTPGDEQADLLVRARAALLDSLEALAEQRAAVIVIGAQAVYLRTGGIDVALAEATKDSDVALDPRLLVDVPRVEAAMQDAGFAPDVNGQPGAWVNPDGIPVDLMVPEQLAGAGGRRGARIPPHGSRATRRARGIEAVLVDHDPLVVRSLDSVDQRAVTVNVAGAAALLVAKLHKIAERVGSPTRLNDKDAHDSYRLLRASDTSTLRTSFECLLEHELCGDVTRQALEYLDSLFAAGPDALGCTMAGRAEEGVGEPEQVAVAVSLLAGDLLASLR